MKDKTSKKDAKDAQQIAKDARRSISKFCMEECSAYCCKKGYLPLNETEVELVTQNQKNELLQKNILVEMEDKTYVLDFNGACPSLNGSVCTIHKNKLRPSTCLFFPLFIEENKIILSNRCLAVRQNMLYSYVKELIALGFSLKK